MAVHGVHVLQRCCRWHHCSKLGKFSLAFDTKVCDMKNCSSTNSAFFTLSLQRENYGSSSFGGEQSHAQAPSSARRFDFLRDPKILALGLTTCVFEGTMYLFIFFWSAALKNARDIASAGFSSTDLPFGLIFSSFMCTMLAGSAIFSRLRRRNTSSSEILLGVIVVVSSCLGLVVNVQDERFLFIAFCIIEGCIGVYFPAMASLKSQLVNDDIRGRVYSVLRAPLNVFVVVVHCLDEEGMISHSKYSRKSVYLQRMQEALTATTYSLPVQACSFFLFSSLSVISRNESASSMHRNRGLMPGRHATV